MKFQISIFVNIRPDIDLADLIFKLKG